MQTLPAIGGVAVSALRRAEEDLEEVVGVPLAREDVVAVVAVQGDTYGHGKGFVDIKLGCSA